MLSAKLQKALSGVLQEGEVFVDTIEGLRHQGAALTDPRIIVVKTGVNAGAVMGAKVSSYSFEMVAAIEVQTSGVRTVLTVRTPGDRSPTGFISGGRLGNDVWSSPNTVPFNRSQRDEAQRFADHASQVRAQTLGAVGARAAQSGPPSVADELSKLAALRDAGVISEEEFAAQKAKLLA